MKHSSQPTKPARRRWVRRILWTSFIVLVVVPFIGMHCVSVVFALHDRSMKPYASKVVTSSLGHTLRCYELKQADAKWDIVFIHGTPATAAVFGEQFRRPFPGANLIAADRPGFGGSGPDRRHTSLDDQANAIGALLPHEPSRRTILVGHSYGAPVALTAALKFPDQIAGVVLIGGSIDPAQERPFPIQHAVDWPLVSWLVPRSLRQCNRELLTLRDDLTHLQAQLPKLTVPVVMLHGGSDYQVPVSNVEYVRSQLTNAGKDALFAQLIFPEYNHFIPWEHPDAVEAAIRKVTDRLSPQSDH
ncbi:MAG: alpha/beta hydrolase [Chthoniobacteraceae bacterium]